MTASLQQNAPDPAHDAELRAAADTLASRPLTELFATDAGRAERFRVEAAGLLYSYAKQRVDDEALAALFAFAQRCDLEGGAVRIVDPAASGRRVLGAHGLCASGPSSSVARARDLGIGSQTQGTGPIPGRAGS